jgi:cytochrome c553
MFGIYFVDAFGNKELLYRDPNISSVWAKPLVPRSAPPVLTGGLDKTATTGTFAMQNVYESWPKLPDGEENRIVALRIVQVLPKTTPNANDPMVGAAFASPGKQVLGTVPVEKDGSAYFECPAETPILFQALDARGRAVQMMRSLTYLQPGEKASCIGCHEHRMQTFTTNRQPLAMQRTPSTIVPGPDGSKPLSYPLLVQPVLDQHCVNCHGKTAKEKGGGLVLTGEPDGHYTKSYNGLITRVSYTAWSMPEGNYEPLTEPNRFGARASALVKLLDGGHYDVKLSEEDWNRLNTWIGANALFYGTFDPADQQRQQRGERIAGPALL